ncbi:MAG: T9SS type A sorting domain-containing protein [bacterium]|nr:T9SS type A sorting domain-containing protein [bacterium]
MKPQTLLAALATLLLALALPAQAHWPTNRFENVAVSGDSVTPAANPYAFRIANGSTLITFGVGLIGNSYQIINRYGDLVFPEPQSLWPAISSYYTGYPVSISDQRGGVIACWRSLSGGSIPHAYFAQRLDSLGNLLWGKSAVQLYLFDDNEEWDICPDGSGGLFFSTAKGDPSSGLMDIRLQHVNSRGQPLLGDSGMVAISAPQNQDRPKLAPDGQGGVYIAWRDYRPPYWGAIFVGRFDAMGQQVWPVGGGNYVAQYSFSHKVCADSAGGLLILKSIGSLYTNTIYRIHPNGSILWTLPNVSYGDDACILPGEPGFFYIGFFYDDDPQGVYAQRIDLEGHIRWYLYQPGARLVVEPNWNGSWARFAYYNNNLYCVCNLNSLTGSIRTFRAQIVNSSGQCRFSNSGAILSISPTVNGWQHKTPIPDGRGGMVGVMEYYNGVGLHEIQAKHMNPNGTLGGPTLAGDDELTFQKSATLEIKGIDSKSATYVLSQSTQVKLELYNVLGARVKILQDGYLAAGTYTVQIDNQQLPSGVYFLRLQAGEEAMVKKMVMLK